MIESIEHSFSVEMKSKASVKRMVFSNDDSGQVFFEGCLGKLTNVALVEDLMLEITGQNGILRLDITQREIEKVLKQSKRSRIRGGRL